MHAQVCQALHDRGFELSSEEIRCAGFLLHPADPGAALPVMMSEQAMREAVDEFARDCPQLPAEVRQRRWKQLYRDCAAFQPLIARLLTLEQILSVPVELPALPDIEQDAAWVLIASTLASPEDAARLLRSYLYPEGEPPRPADVVRHIHASVIDRVPSLAQLHPTKVLSLKARIASVYERFCSRDVLERSEPDFDVDRPTLSRAARTLRVFFNGPDNPEERERRDKVAMTILYSFLAIVLLGVGTIGVVNRFVLKPRNLNTTNWQTVEKQPPPPVNLDALKYLLPREAESTPDRDPDHQPSEIAKKVLQTLLPRRDDSWISTARRTVMIRFNVTDLMSRHADPEAERRLFLLSGAGFEILALGYGNLATDGTPGIAAWMEDAADIEVVEARRLVAGLTDQRGNPEIDDGSLAACLEHALGEPVVSVSPAEFFASVLQTSIAIAQEQ